MRRWCIVVTAAIALLSAGAIRAAEPRAIRVEVVDKPDARRTNTIYPGNRPPLAPSPFIKLPIGAIKPNGWLRKQLTLEADGMIGHLPELSKFVADPKKSAWASGTGEGDFPWE